LQVNNSNFLAYNNGSSSTLSGFALPSAPCFIAVSVNSSNLYAYAKNLTNGKVLSSSGTGANPGANADSANFAVAQESLLGHFGDGQIAAIAYLTGVTLGPAMLAALGADPWAFWYPNFGTLTPAFFSQPGSGGATTMAAAAGTFTLTGEAAIFEDFDPTTVAGAFVLTGEPATTLYALTAAQGSFAETGQGVTFLALTLMIAAQGTFTETGEPALFEQFLASAGGVYALTGFSALLGAPAAFLVAGGGTFILMGRPAIELLSSGWRTWYGPVTQWSSTTKPANNWTLEPPRVPWSQG
jgi:hypothetical protein